jgi:hypothetical protein
MDQSSLEKLVERFGIKPSPQTSPYDHIGLFLLDLSDLLILPGATKVVFFSLMSELECDQDVAGQLEEIIQTRSYRDRLKLFEYSRATSEGLRALGEIPGLAAFSRSDLGQLKKTTPLKNFLTSLLVQKFPLASFNPYTFQGPVTGSRFFGREDELKILRLQTGKSFVLSGVRRSGKTSLMLELIRRIQVDQQTQEISVFVNFETCQKLSDLPYLVLSRLAEELPSTSQALVELRRNLTWLASSHQWKNPDHLSHLESTLWKVISSTDGQHRIRFLFDEYDRVIALELPHDRIFTRVCRDLVMRTKTAAARGRAFSGFLQFIFAGSRKLYEEILLGSSPFFNLGAERLPLQNFDLATLTALVTKPFKEIGVKVHDADSMAQALLERTGGHPATTQHLLSLVFTDPQVERVRAVGKEDVGRAAGQHEFLGLLRNTLEMNVSPLGRFVLAQLAVSLRDKVNTKFIQGVGRQRHFIRFDENLLNVELQDLADSGYLRALEFAAGQSNYKLAVPVVQQLFTADDLQSIVQELLAKKICTLLPRS